MLLKGDNEGGDRDSSKSLQHTATHPPPNALGFVEEARNEFVIYPILHDNPCAGYTSLPRCHEGSKSRPVDSTNQICVIEDDNGCLRIWRIHK